MSIFELSRKSVKLTDLNIPLSGVLLIARAPEEIQTEVIENAEQGEKISVADVKKAIADANEIALKKTEQQIARCLMDQSCTSRPIPRKAILPVRRFRCRPA
jgi:hypothetical protein